MLSKESWGTPVGSFIAATAVGYSLYERNYGNKEKKKDYSVNELHNEVDDNEVGRLDLGNKSDEEEEHSKIAILLGDNYKRTVGKLPDVSTKFSNLVIDRVEMRDEFNNPSSAYFVNSIHEKDFNIMNITTYYGYRDYGSPEFALEILNTNDFSSYQSQGVTNQYGASFKDFVYIEHDGALKLLSCKRHFESNKYSKQTTNRPNSPALENWYIYTLKNSWPYGINSNKYQQVELLNDYEVGIINKSFPKTNLLLITEGEIMLVDVISNTYYCINSILSAGKRLVVPNDCNFHTKYVPISATVHSIGNETAYLISFSECISTKPLNIRIGARGQRFSDMADTLMLSSSRPMRVYYS